MVPVLDRVKKQHAPAARGSWADDQDFMLLHSVICTVLDAEFYDCQCSMHGRDKTCGVVEEAGECGAKKRRRGDAGRAGTPWPGYNA